MKHVLKKGKAEGSVLFTVISVMLVMVVFLMSTMILTSSANRRSYYSYFETQAEYAAKAAIDAVTNSAYTDSNFYEWVKTSTSGAVDPDALPTVSVSFPESNIQFSDGDSVVDCTIERVTNKTMVWDDLTQAVHEQTAYKITATAAVGNGRNRSEATVVNYIYENYQVPDPDKLPSVDNNAKNTIYGWTKSNGDPGDEPDKSLNSAVWSLGVTATGNNMTYFGPQYSGMSLIPVGRLKYTDYAPAMKKTNENYAVGDTLAIGNYTISGSYGMHFTFEKFGESVQIYGNFDNRSNDSNGISQSVQFRAKLSGEEIKRENAAWTNGIPYYRQPYVYIDGTIQNNGGNILLGYDESGNRPEDGDYYNVNLYCGGIEGGSSANCDVSVAGDVYLYDPAIKSSMTGSGNYTTLARFANNNVNKANTKMGDEYSVGGNLVCNNLELNLNTNSKGMTIAGDLIFTNPAGTLKITNNITVKGKVLCAGALSDDDRNKINCNTIVTRTYAKVGGTVLDINNAEQYGVGDYIWTGENNDKYFAYDNYLFDKYSDDAYRNLYTYEDGTLDATGYDTYKATGYALMPYSLRLDEIFDEYLRWDLASDDITKAAEAAHNDKLVQESIAAGHSWTDENGDYQMKTFDTEETWVVDTWREELQECHEYNINSGDFYDKHPDGTWSDVWDGEHWSTGTYMDVVQVPDTGHWANKVYVPFTKARSGQNFITHFTPVPTADAQKKQIGSQYYIDNFKDFSKGGEIKFATINDRVTEGRHSDVSVVYHSTTRTGNDPYDTFTLTNALIITDHTIINMSGTTDEHIKTPVFIDPYAKGYDDNEPLRIVVRGSAIACRYFVINNTATYESNYTDDFRTLRSQDRIAGRRSVYIYYEDGVSGGSQPLCVLMSGTVGQFNNGTVNVVSNPIYPDSSLGDKDPWATLDPRIKFSYELVPNAVIFGEAGANYYTQNGSFFNAELIMPNSTLQYPNSELAKFKTLYQEEYYSAIYEKGALPCVGMGTVLCKGITNGSNTASIVYIGDAHRGGSSEIRETEPGYSTKNSEKLGTDENDYFNNDHMGAS